MKKNLKNLFVVIILCINLFVFSGCNQPLTPAQIQQAAAEVNSLNDQAIAYQQQAVLIAKGLADANIIDPNMMAKVNRLNADADKVRAKISTLAAALQSVPASGNSNQDIITLLQQLNAASVPFNPYAAPTAGVLAIINLILMAIAKRKASQLAASNQALNEVVTANGVAAASSPAAASALSAAHEQVLSAPTVAKVAAIQAS